MTTKTVAARQVKPLVNDRATLGLSSALVGTALIFLVGFAPMSAVHNAAHDTRHTAAFPCH
jgi:cobalt transporter subunit CbtB